MAPERNLAEKRSSSHGSLSHHRSLLCSYSFTRGLRDKEIKSSLRHRFVGVDQHQPHGWRSTKANSIHFRVLAIVESGASIHDPFVMSLGCFHIAKGCV